MENSFNIVTKSKIVLAVMIIGALFISGCSQASTATEASDANTSDTHTNVNEETITQKSDAETAETETASNESESEPESESEQAVNSDLSGGWSNVMDIPAEPEIAKFNESSVQRAPYLCGWLDIGEETQYTGYSIDFKADHLPYGTYFCCASMKMDLSSLYQEYDDPHMDSWLSFYAGLQMWDKEEGSGSIMSFWDIYCKDKSDETSIIRAKLVYPEGSEAKSFDHEGNGVNYLSAYPWEPECWYRMLLQCSLSEENGHTLVEQWVCNLETQEWTELCCYDTGLTDSSFVGSPAVFLENYMPQYAGCIRTAEYKNIRILPKGSTQWFPVKQVTMLEDSGNPGSYCFGSDEEQFWMISTGLEGRSISQSINGNTYHVTSCLNEAPF